MTKPYLYSARHLYRPNLILTRLKSIHPPRKLMRVFRLSGGGRKSDFDRAETEQRQREIILFSHGLCVPWTRLRTGLCASYFEVYFVGVYSVRQSVTDHSKPFRTSLKMILVNGALCTIQVRSAFKFRPNGREYARLDIGPRDEAAQVALLSIRRGRTLKLCVIPLTHLRNISSVYIPANGKYATGTAKNPGRVGLGTRKRGTCCAALKVRTNYSSPAHEVHI